MVQRINNERVIDATRRQTITVTPLDVRKGETKNPSACAAARACCHLDEVTQARVHLGRTYLKTGRVWVRYLTPQSLRAEIIAFDRGAAFEPGEYTLSPIPPSMRQSRGKAVGSKTGKTKPKHLHKPRAKYHVVHGVRAHGANR